MAQVSFESVMGESAEFPRASDAQASADERTYATFVHLTLLAYHFVPVPVIGPLIMWAIKKDQSPFINDHGKEAMNFQISLVIYVIAGTIITAITCGLGALVFIPIYGLAIVGMILASIAANRGQYYRYPACLRFIN